MKTLLALLFLSLAASAFAADRKPNILVLRGTEPAGKFDYTTESFGVETASFIERNKDHPWFVYLAFNAVHSPLQAPEKFKQLAAAWEKWNAELVPPAWPPGQRKRKE